MCSLCSCEGNSHSQGSENAAACTAPGTAKRYPMKVLATALLSVSAVTSNVVSSGFPDQVVESQVLGCREG